MSLSPSLPLRPWLPVALILIGTLDVTSASAEENAGSDAMAPLARLVGGSWHLGDQYQVFEWGLDGRTLRARAYRDAEGEPVLISDGLIYFHPGEQAIRATVVAEGMGIDLFEYRMRFEGDRMVADLQTFGAMSGDFLEIWQFTDDDHFEWSLLHKTDEGSTEIMGGTFERR